MLPQQLITPLPILPLTPEQDPLKAPVDMPENFMENERAPPEKSVGVEDVEMTETELTAQAADTAAPAAGAAAAPLVPQAFMDAAAALEAEEEEDGELRDTQGLRK